MAFPRLAAMNDELRALGEEYWEYRLENAPSTALLLGDHRYDDRFENMSREAEDRHLGRLRGFAARAEAVDDSELSSDDRISRDVLIFDTSTQVAATETRPAELFVSHTTGPQAMVPIDIRCSPAMRREVTTWRSFSRTTRANCG